MQYRRPWFYSSVRKIPWRRDRLPSPVFMGFPGGSDGKESACIAGHLGSIPRLGRSPGGGYGNPLQYSCHGQRSLAGYSLWGCKEWDTTEQLSLSHASNGASQVALVVKNLPASAGDLPDVSLIPGLGISPGEGITTRSSILAWRIVWTERSLAGYSPQGHTALDTTQ